MEDGEQPAQKRTPLTDKIAHKVLHRAIDFLNTSSDHYTTYHQRPKRALDNARWADPGLRRESTAIVMQGPPAQQDDFTLETLKFYAREMRDVRLILSTWRDTPAEVLKPIADLGVDIVLCDKPQEAGFFNVNMQTVSAMHGMRRAAELGAEWALKTRTDQRIYDPHALTTLASLCRAFPVRGTYQQKHRIIGVGQGTLKFAPYHVTDQTVFGHIGDMQRYFSPPLRGSTAPGGWPTARDRIFLDVPIGELCRHGAPEAYYASSFLEQTGRRLAWTIEDTWAAYRDQFCFIDYTMIDLFWVKSQTFTQREHQQYYHVSNRQEMGFSEWLLLYTEQLPVSAAHRYEGVTKTCFNFDVPIVPDHEEAGSAQSAAAS